MFEESQDTGVAKDEFDEIFDVARQKFGEENKKKLQAIFLRNFLCQYHLMKKKTEQVLRDSDRGTNFALFAEGMDIYGTGSPLALFFEKVNNCKQTEIVEDECEIVGSLMGATVGLLRHVYPMLKKEIISSININRNKRLDFFFTEKGAMDRGVQVREALERNKYHIPHDKLIRMVKNVAHKAANNKQASTLIIAFAKGLRG